MSVRAYSTRGGDFGIGRALDQAFCLEVLQLARKRGLRDVDAALQLAEALGAAGQFVHDEQGPFALKQLLRGDERGQTPKFLGSGTCGRSGHADSFTHVKRTCYR
jgi:hypothetical protein